MKEDRRIEQNLSSTGAAGVAKKSRCFARSIRMRRNPLRG
jgi:hypothetical protein